MLRTPTPAVPDEEIEKEPSNNENSIPIQPKNKFQKSSDFTMNYDYKSTINSSRPRPTISYLSKEVSSSSTTSSRRPWPPQRMSQSSGHFNVDLPRSYAETGLHKLAHSQDSQSMHSSTIDHQSLMDALNSDSDQEPRQHYHQRRRSVVRQQQQHGGGEDSQYSTTTTDDEDSFDRDSIELAVSSGSSDNANGRINNSNMINSGNDDDDGDIMVENVGSETLMEFLEAHKDLEQQMRAIEQQENDNEEYQENNNDDGRNKEEKEEKTEGKEDEFEMPSFIRVLYMGSASEKDKRIFLKKLSQAFATLFYYDTPSWLRNPKMFKERKHHLLLMSLVPPDVDEEEQLQDNLIETCEDNGLSIIEADFTWSTTVAMETQHHLTSMIEQYICLQCESARQDLMSLKKKSSPICDHHHHHRKNSNSDKFDGFVYPDKAPNGIDLCVYFYNGSDTEDEKKNRIAEDMILLWRLKKLGVPIMPILSGGVNTTTTTSLPSSRASKSRSQHQFHHYNQPLPRPLSSSTTVTTNISTASSPLITPTAMFKTGSTIDEQRTQFADLLAQYKIRCVDLSLAKLDVGQPPSFQKRRRSSCYYQPADTNNNTIAHSLEERLGKDWAASSMTSPAPYQILTIDQFAALDHQIVFSILKQSRQKAIKREKVLSAIQKEEEEEHQRQLAITTVQNYNNNNRSTSFMATDSSSSWIFTSVGNVLMNSNARMFQHLQNRFVASLFIILMIIGAILILFHFPSLSLLQKTDIVKNYGDKSWNLTAVVGITTSKDDNGILKQSLSFIVDLGDDKKRETWEENVQQQFSLLTPSSSKDDNTNRYECKVSLPSCISQAPTSPLAKLDLQFPYPVNFTYLDFQCPLMNLFEWQDSMEKENNKSHSTFTTDDTMKTRSSSSDNSNIINGDEQRQKTSRPKIRSGYWEHIYHTTNYLLHHQTKILNLIFNS